MCRKICFVILLVCLTVTVTLCQSTLTELDESGGGSPSPSLASAATNYDDNYDEEEDVDDVINVDPKKDPGNVGKPQRAATLSFVKELKNVTKEAGDFLKLKCEITGSIPANSIQVQIQPVSKSRLLHEFQTF